MTITAPAVRRLRAAANGSRRDHSGLFPDPLRRGDLDGTPILSQTTAASLRTTMRSYSDAFDAFREHDSVRIITTVDDNALLFTTMPRGLDLSRWFVLGEVDSTTDSDAALDAGGTTDALETFDRLRHELGMTKRELFLASGVKPRTYYSWQASRDTRARLDSVQGLWVLADVVGDLNDILDVSPRRWFRTDGARRALLIGRQFEELLDLAQGIPRRRKLNGVGFEPNAVLAEVEVPVDAAPLGPAHRMKVRKR